MVYFSGVRYFPRHRKSVILTLQATSVRKDEFKNSATLLPQLRQGIFANFAQPGTPRKFELQILLYNFDERESNVL